MKIRPKMSLLFGGVGLVAVALTTFVNYKTSEQALKESVSDQLVSLRASRARHLDSYFRSVRRNLELVAADRRTSEALSEFAKGVSALPKPTQPAMVRRIIQDRWSGLGGVGEWLPANDRESSLQELFGTSATHSGTGAYKATLDQFGERLDSLRVAYGFEDLQLVEKSSMQVVYSSARSLELGKRVSESPVDRSALGEVAKAALGGRFGASIFELWVPARSQPRAFLATPLRDGVGVVGCVVASIGPDEVSRIMSGTGNWVREGLGETGEVILIAKGGLLESDSRLFHTNLEAFQKIVGTAAAANARQLGTVTAVAKIPCETFQHALEGKDGVEELEDYRGQRVLAAYEPYVYGGARWAIVCQRDLAEAFEPLERLRNLSLLAGACIVLVMAIVGIVVSNTFTRRLEKLGFAAQRFGKGEKGVRVDAKGKDEFAELGHAFDTMAEEAEKLEELAQQIRRNIVHDLKTPLTVVKGMAETLRQPGVAEDPALRSELLGTISEESDRLLDDLQDILEPVTADYKPMISEFDMAALVASVVTAELHTDRAEDHRIETTGIDKPCLVRADKRKLRRVVENLLSNAVKYSPGEGKVVKVELTRQSHKLLVSVSDQGLGLSPDQIAQVLGKGGRVDDHARLGIEGTGIGLGSVRLILQAHGGDLKVESEVGRGSKFTAVIPA